MVRPSKGDRSFFVHELVCEQSPGLSNIADQYNDNDDDEEEEEEEEDEDDDDDEPEEDEEANSESYSTASKRKFNDDDDCEQNKVFKRKSDQSES